MKRYRFYYEGEYICTMNMAEALHRFQYVLAPRQIQAMLNGDLQGDEDGNIYALIECSCE